ncbi:MAG: PaaI family thioesterase [Flavobacteriales bacterium]|nr:PaaI family thioesterase [Flavobacteriales bacterium]
MDTVKGLYDKFNNVDKGLDFELTVYGPGIIEYRTTIAEKHLSSPGVGHGAITAAMMDAVLGTTALTAVYDDGNLVSTVEFKVNYFKPTFLGDKLIGKGEIEFQGKSLICTSAKIYKEATGELVSKALGTFNIYPMEKRGLKKPIKTI